MERVQPHRRLVYWEGRFSRRRATPAASLRATSPLPVSVWRDLYGVRPCRHYRPRRWKTVNRKQSSKGDFRNSYKEGKSTIDLEKIQGGQPQIPLRPPLFAITVTLPCDPSHSLFTAPKVL